MPQHKTIITYLIAASFMGLCAAQLWMLITGDILTQMHRMFLFVPSLLLVGLYLVWCVMARDKSFRLHIAIAVVTFLLGLTFQIQMIDPLRHSYASALVTYISGAQTAEKLGNFVEWLTAWRSDQHYNSGMDYCNNHHGRKIALTVMQNGGTWHEVERAVISAYHNGSLIEDKTQFTEIDACLSMLQFPPSN